MSAAALDVERRVRAPSSKPGLLSLTVKDRSALHQAYMPFVKNGGLFVPTSVAYQLGEEVFMLVTLLDNPPVSLAGRVVWITPKGAFGTRRPAGVGVQISELDRGATQKQIEQLLAGSALLLEKSTHTL